MRENHKNPRKDFWPVRIKKHVTSKLQKRLPLKNIKIPDLDEYINPDQEFTVEEWRKFVQKHEHLLMLPEKASIEVTTNAISKAMKNMNKVLDPLEHFHAKMSHESMGKEQEKEFKSIINVLVTEPDMEGTILGKSYKLQNGLLYSYQDEFYLTHLLSLVDKGGVKMVVGEAIF